MIKIKRLNLDSSWYIKFNKLNFVLDPWLIGSEIDGFKWLNEQWHIKPPVPIDDIPNYDSIVISQNYEDHCHIETLKRLPNDKSILATEKAYNKLKKQMLGRAEGGRIGKLGGGLPRIPMGMPRVNAGGIRELDYRQSGGFVPMGVKEKADDVPAMLSKNEFVMTADAVRGAGGGSVEKGAQKMYDTMKRLEGRVV